MREATSIPTPPANVAGLTSDEARVRLERFGPNRLVPAEQPSGAANLLRLVRDPMGLLLIGAGAVYLALGDTLDAVVILVAVAPILAVGFALETRAERALEQLRRLTAPTAVVWRDGRRQTIATEDVVPGDLVFVQEGDIVASDGVLVAGSGLAVDESALTGESLPVAKDAEGEAKVFAGTTVLSGRALARVETTGLGTRYGKIGVLVSDIRGTPTPLERLTRRLVQRLAVVAVAVCAGVVAIELGRGGGWGAALIAGVSLAIAAVPEEFPMVYTLYLTLGARRLAREKALVRRMPSVETLGGTTVICTDKTGTLTLGKLDVADAAAVGDATDGALLEAAVLACEPDPFDPLEQALVRHAVAAGIDVSGLHRGRLVHDYPFDPADKYMSHVWERSDGRIVIAAKGALEGVLRHVSDDRAAGAEATAANERLAGQGMRVIAIASGSLTGVSGVRAEDERGLRLRGVIAFADPLRPGVSEALAECRNAGIRVIMITGDHPLTAHTVAEDLKLPHEDAQIATGDDLDSADDARLAVMAARTNIFARTRPEQKHRLVHALRAGGEVVAMTGDGINDAPALREADIGVAMGERGTEVARASGDMVLLDDNFATIVRAVREGRRVFANLERAFSYLIAFHLPIVLAALVVPLTGEPLLLLPIHIVWLELVMHPTSSLVFEGDPPAPGLMRRPPRPPGSGLLSGPEVVRPLLLGLVLFGGILALYLGALAHGTAERESRAMAFAALVLGQVLLVLEERAGDAQLWRAAWHGNRVGPAVLGLTVVSLALALYLPWLADAVRLAPLSAIQIGIAAGVALLTTLWWEAVKLVRRP